MTRLADCHNIADLRRVAKRRLPRGVFEFIDRGTEDEVAVRENRAAIERIRLIPRMPLDVSNRSLASSLFGAPVSMPLAIAPTGAAGLAWYKGELELARAAKAAGIPFTMATGSMTKLEEVAREAGGRLWFQLYVWPDRELTYALVKRAAENGYEALVVTVDTPVSPNREYNTRNGFGVPFRPSVSNIADVILHPEWLITTLLPYLCTVGMPRQENHPPEFHARETRAAWAPRFGLSDSVDWEELKRL
ncbi:MAG TPA: alpha-hydroxy acid oxidase, partial [Acetobacteraceae bacterium]